jgi:hypothetical protein
VQPAVPAGPADPDPAFQEGQRVFDEVLRGKRPAAAAHPAAPPAPEAAEDWRPPRRAAWAWATVAALAAVAVLAVVLWTGLPR